MIKCSTQTSAKFRTFCTDRQTHTLSPFLSHSTHRNKFPPTCTDNIRGGDDKAWCSAHTYASVPFYAGFEPAHVCRLKTAGALARHLLSRAIQIYVAYFTCVRHGDTNSSPSDPTSLLLLELP
jgi:hypothetical protein